MLGCKGHPESTLLLLKDHWSRRGFFCSILGLRFSSQKTLPMADSCLGSDATLSQPLIADPNQLPRYQRQEVFDVPWGWVSSCAEAAHSHVIPPSCCLLGTAKLIRLGPVLQSFHMFLISAENHSPDSCHLYIINEQRYHLFARLLSTPSHKRLFSPSFFPFHSFFFFFPELFKSVWAALSNWLGNERV